MKRGKIVHVGEFDGQTFSGWAFDGSESECHGQWHHPVEGLKSVTGWSVAELAALHAFSVVFGKHAAVNAADYITESIPAYSNDRRQWNITGCRFDKLDAVGGDGGKS